MKSLHKIALFEDPRRALSICGLLALAVLQLTGCAVGPKYHAPVVQAPSAYKEAGDGNQPSPMTRTLAASGGQFFRINS